MKLEIFLSRFDPIMEHPP